MLRGNIKIIIIIYIYNVNVQYVHNSVHVYYMGIKCFFITYFIVSYNLYDHLPGKNKLWKFMTPSNDFPAVYRSTCTWN